MVKEDPDAQCTRKLVLIGQGRGRVKQAEVKYQIIRCAEVQ